MGDPRVRIFVKIVLDLLFFLIVLSIYFIDVFQYMDDYHIGTTVILKETPYNTLSGKSTPLTEIIIASYSDFDDHFCDNPVPKAKPVCDKRKDFETSGILFLVFSCISHALLLYGVLALLGMACGCSCCGFLKMTFVHYLYPATYAIGLVLFIFISEVFSLDPPTGSDVDKMNVQAGLVLMFAAQIVACTSLIYFFFTKTTMKSLILVTHKGYVPVKT